MKKLAWLNRNLYLLMAGRFLRSMAQGFLIVIVTIYLSRIGFSGIQIGFIFTVTIVVSLIFAILVGFFADRYGRKLVIIVMTAISAVSAFGFLFTTNYYALMVLIAAGTIGRGGGAGSGGAFGPFYPAEQALITDSVKPAFRNQAFSYLSIFGTVGSAVGSILALIPSHDPDLFGMGWRGGYLFLMALASLIYFVMIFVTLPIKEKKDRPKRQKAFQLSWKLLGKLSITNAVNGLGIGFLGPILVYWFFVKYGAGTDAIGILYTIVNLMAIIPFLMAAPLAKIFGSIKTIVATRIFGVASLILMAFMPTFFLAGVFFTIRMLVIAVGNPLRQSFVMGQAKSEERSTVASLSNLPQQITSSIGPVAGGYLIDVSLIEMPILFAAGFQFVNAILYWYFFKNSDEHNGE
ncbi:MAG: MFS transporter [Athalassotoga sp.]|uniref:MFS transporter n=1 Tax=Athalassotoga sp. TaxID=2022597 RepID=UPI003D06EEFD